MEEVIEVLIGKVILKGEMELKTGLHIGASKETMKIGGIDSPVVRDPITDYPYIPGSSLKGKLRSLWEKVSSKEDSFYNMSEIKRHECELVDQGKEEAKSYKFKSRAEIENCPVCSIFGTAKGDIPSRIIVRDLHLTEKSKENLKKIDTGLKYTEWKFENAIDRITAQASPRQIERVPAGSVFGFEIIYNVENKSNVERDLKNIQRCLDLLKEDYLGGQGSRGYGKVEFSTPEITVKKVEYYLESKEDAKREFKNLEDAIKFLNT